LRWAGRVAGVRELRIAYNISIRRYDGQNLFRGRDDNIKMGLKRSNMGRFGLDLLWLSFREQWWAVVNAVMNIWVTQQASNFMSS